MTTSPPTSKSTPTTLLEALKSFQTLQKTRHNLIQELESSLSSYLIPSSTPSLPEPPATTNGERPSCASQALSLPTLQQLDQHLSSASSEDVQDPLTTIKIRPPNEFELTEILRIGFLGLLEINNELTMLELTLEETFKRADLGKIVGNVKGLEEERFRISIERDQLRRLSIIETERDFSIPIQEKESRRQELSQEIREEFQEILAEIAELQHES